MINGKRILAIIPARAGSKRLPNKNILPLAGKPLIAWSIDAAKNSRYIDDVVASTDSEQIMAIAGAHGAEVPFRRPDALAGDTASSNAVMLHAIEELQKNQRHYDIVVLLQPTSPLRRTTDIDAALEMFVAKQAQGVISVCECEHSPLWANTLPEDESLEHFIPEHVRGMRSQDLPTYYRFNGALYLFSVEAFIAQKGIFYTPGVFAYVMEPRLSVDIDSMLDFKLAECLVANENQ